MSGASDDFDVVSQGRRDPMLVGESPARTVDELDAVQDAARKERRERIATVAMQGLLVNRDLGHSPGFHVHDIRQIASMAAALADALIAELDE